MQYRVKRAHTNQRHYQLATAVCDLPPDTRDAVLALIDILTTQEAAAPRYTRRQSQQRRA